MEGLLIQGTELLFKWMAVAGLGLYTFFGIVILKQTSIMAESIDSEANGIIKLFAWVHLLMAIILTVIAAVIL